MVCGWTKYASLIQNCLNKSLMALVLPQELKKGTFEVGCCKNKADLWQTVICSFLSAHRLLLWALCFASEVTLTQLGQDWKETYLIYLNWHYCTRPEMLKLPFTQSFDSFLIGICSQTFSLWSHRACVSSLVSSQSFNDVNGLSSFCCYGHLEKYVW